MRWTQWAVMSAFGVLGLVVGRRQPARSPYCTRQNVVTPGAPQLPDRAQGREMRPRAPYRRSTGRIDPPPP